MKIMKNLHGWAAERSGARGAGNGARARKSRQVRTIWRRIAWRIHLASSARHGWLLPMAAFV
jgi:hypothetical protein